MPDEYRSRSVLLETWERQFNALTNVARRRTLVDVEIAEMKRGAMIAMIEILGQQFYDSHVTSVPTFIQNSGIMFVNFPVGQGKVIALSFDYSVGTNHWKVFTSGTSPTYCSPDRTMDTMSTMSIYTEIGTQVRRLLSSAPTPAPAAATVDREGMREIARWLNNEMNEMRDTAGSESDEDGGGPYRTPTGALRRKIHSYFKKLFAGTQMAEIAESSYTVNHSENVARIKLHFGMQKYMTLALDYSTADNNWRIEMSGTRSEYHSEYRDMDVLYRDEMDGCMRNILSDLGLRTTRILTQVAPLVPVDRIQLPPDADHVYRLDMA